MKREFILFQVAISHRLRSLNLIDPDCPYVSQTHLVRPAFYSMLARGRNKRTSSGSIRERADSIILKTSFLGI